MCKQHHSVALKEWETFCCVKNKTPEFDTDAFAWLLKASPAPLSLMKVPLVPTLGSALLIPFCPCWVVGQGVGRVVLPRFPPTQHLQETPFKDTVVKV